MKPRILMCFLFAGCAAPNPAPAPPSAHVVTTRPSRSAAAPGSHDPRPGAKSEDLPRVVNIDQVLTLLRDRSPRTAADRSSVAITRADEITASTLPNPELAYSGDRLLGGTNTGSAHTDEVSLSQPLLLFGQRSARRNAAEAHSRLARAQTETRFSERERLAREQFSTLLARQEHLKLLEQSHSDLERVSQVVSGRASAGDKSRYDVARIEAETNAIDAAVADARAQVAEASGGLGVLIGVSHWTPRADGELAPQSDPIPAVDELLLLAESNRPDLREAQLKWQSAREDVTVAKKERMPVPVVSLGGGLTTDADSSYATFGLTIPLPLFDRGTGPIAHAEAAATTAELEFEALAAESRADIERAFAVYSERRSEFDVIDREVNDRLPAMITMAENAYREGQGTILELLDALRLQAELKSTRVDALEALVGAQTDVLHLAGVIDSD